MAKKLSQEQIDKQKNEDLLRARDHMNTEAVRIGNAILPRLIKEQQPFLDVHRMLQRAQSILLEKVKATSFENAKINNARRNQFFDSIMAIKTMQIKAPEKMDDMDKRVEPLARDLLNAIMEPDLLFSDNEHLDGIIANDDEMLVWATGRQYLDLIYDHFLTAIKANEEEANKRKWGKAREDITWKDLNDVMTRDFIKD